MVWATALTPASNDRRGIVGLPLDYAPMVGVLASAALPDFALAPGVVAGLAGGAAAALNGAG